MTVAMQERDERGERGRWRHGRGATFRMKLKFVE
jgi:hypothetical protein